MKKLTFCIFVLLVVLNSSFLFSLESRKPSSKVKINDTVLKVEWAMTDQQRVHGLQGRSHLNENEGMIFDYGSENILSFWMKDTHIPLSIAFIDRNGNIREIANMSPNSLDSHQSKNKVRYALEVNQGWFERNHVCVGDKVQFQAG